MRTKITSVALALALVGAFIAPASAAQAATGTLTGTVAWRGAPVRTVDVGWFIPSTGEFSTVKSLSNGTYTLPLPPVGDEYVVYANLDMTKAKQLRVKKGYVGVFYGEGDVRDYAFQTLDTYTSTAASDELDIALAKPGAITGKDSRLRNSGVQLEDLGGKITPMYGVANSIGRFTVKNLVPGRYRLHQPTYDENLIAVTTEIITVTEGETTTIDPKAVAGGRVEGVVKQSNGKPAAGVYVSTYRNGEWTGSDSTDSKGKYTIKSLVDGRHRVEFEFPGSSKNTKGYVAKTVSAPLITNHSTVTRNVTLSTGARIIVATKSQNDSVRLIGPGKETIWGIQNIYGFGDVTFGGLRSGTYKLYTYSTSKQRYSVKTLVVKASKTYDVGTLTATKKAFTLKGKLSGAGAGWSSVSATSSTGLSYNGQADAKGKYSIDGMVPGTYTIEVLSDAHADAVHSLKISQNTTKNYALGKPHGKLVVAFTLDGRPMRSGDVDLSAAGDKLLSGSVKNGRIVATGPTGSYNTVEYFDDGSFFQANSPYWVSVPDTFLPVKITNGTTVYAGKVALEVHQ